MRFSVIIPAHGDEELRERTLKSVRDQGVECEILVIGVGENLSASEARNRGIERAQGDYLVFCDDDDALEAGALKYLSEIIDAEAPDAINYAYREVASLDDAAVFERGALERFDFRDPKDAVRGFKRLFTWLWAWNTCYRRETIAKLRFRDFLAGEDTLFGAEAMALFGKVVRTDVALYRYLQHDKSILHSPSRRQVLDGEKSILAMLEAAKKLKWFEELRAFAYARTRKLLVHYVFKYGARVPASESLGVWRDFKAVAKEFLVSSPEFSYFSRLYYRALLAPWFDAVVSRLSLARIYSCLHSLG